MSRPRETDTQLPPVEFIDSDAAHGMGSDRSNSGPTGSPPDRLDTNSAEERTAINTILTVIAFIAAFGLLMLLGTIGNDAPEVAAPTTTEARDTTTTGPSSSTLPVTREDRLRSVGISIGPGPGLEWLPVGASIDRPFFAWADDSFVADDGQNELRVGLMNGEPTVEANRSLLLDFPGYQLQSWGVDRLLVPDDGLVDHVFVVRRDRAPLRVPLPADAEAPQADLIRTETFVQGAVVEKRFVAIVSGYTQIDHVALGERLGMDLSSVMYVDVTTESLHIRHLDHGLEVITFADTDLSEAEIDQLRQANQNRESVISVDLETGAALPADFPDLRWLNGPLISSDDGVTVWWTDAAQSWQSSTTDGVRWSTTEGGNLGWFTSSGSQLLDLQSGPQIRRSTDGGETWQSTRSPRQETQGIAADDVIVLGRSWAQFAPRTEVRVASNRADLDVVLVAPASDFEVRRPSGEIVASGSFWEPSSDVNWDDATGDYVVFDPTTGDELLRVTEMAVNIAQAQANPMTEINLTRWPADQEHPEWQLASPDELFGAGALVADFVAGDGQILAVVTAVDGYRLFIADATTP